MSEWYRVQAKSATRDLWVTLRWEGKPPLGPHVLPDGTDVWDTVCDGHPDRLPFPVWFAPSNSGKRRGDMLWTEGGPIIASTSLVKVLEDIGATGYRTFDIDLRERNGQPIGGYLGFITTTADPGADIRHAGRMYLTGEPWPSFGALVTARVVDALRAAGADALDIRASDES